MQALPGTLSSGCCDCRYGHDRWAWEFPVQRRWKMVRWSKGAVPMILSQKKIEEIAVAVIRDFSKVLFRQRSRWSGKIRTSDTHWPVCIRLSEPEVSFQKLSSDGSIYGLTAYVDTEYQIEIDGNQRSIFLKTNDVVLDKSFIEPANIRKLCGNADLRWHMSALTRYCFSWIPMTER